MKVNICMKAGLCAAVIFLFAVHAAQAQFWFMRAVPKWLTRYEIGYSYPMAWADYSRVDEYTNPVTGQSQKSTFNTRTASNSGFGVNVGTYFPVKRLGINTVLAVSVSLTEAMYVWDYPVSSADGFNEQGNMIYSSASGISGFSVQLGLPVGADLKFGCDAFSDKAMRFCGTVGAGIFPSGSLSADYDNAGLGGGFTPYVKVEAGVMAGICMKLRLMATMGRMPFYDNKYSLSGWEEVTTQSSLIGRQSVTASLIIMPFSWRWERNEWANFKW